MSINVTRLPRNRANFERLANEAIRDRDLSIAALGLLARLLADGEDFDSIDKIAAYYADRDGGPRRRGRGRDAYRSAAQELEAAGYLTRSNSSGLGGWEPTRVQITALSSKTQVAPGTAKPSPEPPAETGKDAGGLDDGLAVPEVTCEEMPNGQVVPTTAKPSSQPPAETGLRPVRADDGLAVVTPIQTINRPTDLLPPTPHTASDGDSSPSLDGGGGIDLEEDRENDPRAVAFVDALPYERRTPNGREHRDLIAYVTAALECGHTAEALNVEAHRDLANVADRVRVWLFRFKPEELGEPVRIGVPAAGTPDSNLPEIPHCGQCDPHERTVDVNGRVARCVVCHPAATREAASKPNLLGTPGYKPHGAYEDPLHYSASSWDGPVVLPEDEREELLREFARAHAGSKSRRVLSELIAGARVEQWRLAAYQEAA